MRRPYAIALLLLTAGCSPHPERALLLPEPPRALPVTAAVADAPLAAGENVRARELGRGENGSVSLIQIRDRELPHVHTRYDLTVTLARGSGTLWLNGAPLPMHAGDVAFIPKGTPHYFVNAGSEPAAALVAFAPAFSGPDQQPVTAPTAPRR